MGIISRIGAAFAAAGRWIRDGLRAVSAAFTPDVRKALHGLAVAVFAALPGLGLLTQAQADAWSVIATASLQFVAGLLAWVHLSAHQVATWFQSSGRGLIYGLATTVAPALQLVGGFSDAQVGDGLQALSLVLSTVSSVLAAVNVPATDLAASKGKSASR